MSQNLNVACMIDISKLVVLNSWWRICIGLAPNKASNKYRLSLIQWELKFIWFYKLRYKRWIHKEGLTPDQKEITTFMINLSSEVIWLNYKDHLQVGNNILAVINQVMDRKTEIVAEATRLANASNR